MNPTISTQTIPGQPADALILITPAHAETSLHITVNGADLCGGIWSKSLKKWWRVSWPTGEIEEAKDFAREARDIFPKQEVKLRARTVHHEDHFLTAFHYASQCESYAQDEGTEEDYRKLVAEHGKPDWDLL